MAQISPQESPESLFVLIHGLLGSHKHMHAIRDLILLNKDSNSLVLIPCKNGYFKTFDGIEIVGDRIVREIKVFLKTRTEKELKSLKWLSFISYSMGGLIARYVIGEMLPYLEKNYANIRLNTFMTFASPHLGINFFKEGNPLYSVLTALGSTVLGRSGRQLFLKDKEGQDSDKLLLKISKGKYLHALKKFKYRITLANAHHDRTVSFYTSFVTDMNYSCDLNVAEEDSILVDWDKFPKDIILDVTGDPKKCRKSIEAKLKEKSFEGRFSNVLLFIGKAFLVLLYLILLFPLILLINIAATSISYINVWFYKNKAILLSKLSFLNKHWVAKRLSIDLDDEFDDDEMEQLIEVLSRDGTGNDSVKNDLEDLLEADWELKKNDYINKIESMPDDQKDSFCFRYFIEKYTNNNTDKNYKHSEGKLPFDAARKQIYDNLNQLKWIRVPYKLSSINTHRAIVARGGLESASPTNRKALDFNIALLMEVCRYADDGVEI